MSGRFLLSAHRCAWVFVTLALSHTSLAEELPEGAVAAPSATKHVISRYSAAAVIRPRAILNSPAAQMLPVEILQSLFMEAPLIDMSQIEEVVLLFGIDWSLGDMFAVVCRFTETYQRDTILAHLEPIKENSFGAIPVVYRSKDIEGFYAAFPDDRTIILAPERSLRDMFFSKHITGPLAKHLPAREPNSVIQIVCSLEAMRDFLGPLLDGPADLPEELEALRDTANLLATAELDLILDGEGAVKLVLEAHDANSAVELDQNLAETMRWAVRLLENKVDAALVSGASQKTLWELKYYQRLGLQLASSVERRREDDRIVLCVKGDALVAAGLGAVVAECLADDDLDEADSSSDAKEQATTNLQRIGAAISEYQRLHHKAPRSSIASDGTPLLSWRVHLLPFLGEQELYERFHLDEAWDSEHNRPLVAQIPDVYHGADAPDNGKTLYLLANQMASLATPEVEVPSGSPDSVIASGGILVVEANMSRAVEWTRPEIFAFDPNDIFAGLGGLRPGGFLVLQTDGLVDFVSFTTGTDELRARFGRPAIHTAERPAAPVAAPLESRP